jgi:hypothetical protein
MNFEPERDHELSEALRRLEGDARLDEAAWNRLRAGIAARAARHLARPIEADTWWECIAGWARTAIPLAAAVGLIFIVLTQRDIDSGGQTAAIADPGVVERGGLAMLISGEVREQEAVAAIVGPSDRDWLVESVMGGSE